MRVSVILSPEGAVEISMWYINTRLYHTEQIEKLIRLLLFKEVLKKIQSQGTVMNVLQK